MSKSEGNPIVDGFRGKLGKFLVFKKVNGNTIATIAPTGDRGEGTEKQQAARSRFSQAAVFVKSHLKNPANKALYQAAAKRKGFVNARTLAMADFFGSPKITAIDVTAYAGTVGSKIFIEADDELEVKTVMVEILNADGSSVEKGSAVLQPESGVWEYVATVENADRIGDKVVVVATDRPGNTTTKELVL
ncbi:hypothetical protein [Chryseolinea lacunae]|uniref:Uncharacterized protein n=1 Tax=Chryseolinea lacunae TaxID=2801331 RepID=A0ABS1KR21_9BACT|nr:hypothetical protein [Chryseolinea lacunae]MBL0740736.1 hypothetical protein [Chryseolinea lacunae]